MKTNFLLGKSTDHLVQVPETKFFIHQEVLDPFLNLQKESLKQGFQLQAISAFRDYERQRLIWNAKASGQRQLLDSEGKILNFSELSPLELTMSILRWSAIPGCSRHHWGTDIDVYDANTQSSDEVQLVPSETVGSGPASRLHDWLDVIMANSDSFGFYRPYHSDRGGVSPERWHLSYHPLSQNFLQLFTFELFLKHITESDMLLKDVLIEHADEIYQRFVINVDSP